MRSIFGTCLAQARRLVALQGADATQFLQGYVTSNVGASRSEGSFGAMLNANGRVLADVFVYPEVRSGDSLCLRLDCDASLATYLVRHLNLFKLRTKVSIAAEDTADSSSVWSIWSDDGTPLPTFPGWPTVNDQRGPIPAARVLVPSGQTPPDVTEVPPSAWLAHRIVHGVLEGADDFQHAKSFPFECNMDYMRGVHFDKGCYLGQEPTTRTFFRGATKKRVMPVQLSVQPPAGPLPDGKVTFAPGSVPYTPPPGTAVLDAEGQRVGHLCSTHHNVGLALLRLPPATQLHTEAPEGHAPLHVQPAPPPWWEVRGTGR